MEDWRKPSEYEYTKTLTLKQWAWEFLRRNKTYRALWQAQMDAIVKSFEGKKVGDPILMSRDPFGRLRIFGIEKNFPNPGARADKVGDLSWAVGFMGLEPVEDLAAHQKQKPYSVAIAFDLELPLAEQLRAAALLLKEHQESLKAAGLLVAETPALRVRTNLWLTYLRLLDADNKGASIGEMGRVVFADKLDPRKSAQNALRKALAFTEGAYIQLLVKGEGN